MDRLEMIEKGLERKDDIPQFSPGDTVKVHVKVIEGDKERIQVFEGVIIGIKGKSNRETFTVRKISYGVGVERIFPIHSPTVEKVEVVRNGKVRRAKLYYLRDKKGKDTRIKEKRSLLSEREKGKKKIKKTAQIIPDLKKGEAVKERGSSADNG